MVDIRDIRVSVSNQERKTIRTVGVSATTPFIGSLLRTLNDVNATDLTTGNTLVYDQVTDKFIVEVLPKIDGGTF
jgi:hypothetical protein